MADNYRRPQSAILFVFFFLLLVTQAHFPDTRCQYYLRIQSIKLIYWQTSQQGVYLSQLAIYFLNLLEEKKKKKAALFVQSRVTIVVGGFAKCLIWSVLFS